MIGLALVLVALLCLLYGGFVAGGWAVWMIIAAICLAVALLLGFYPVGPPVGQWRR